MGSLPFQLGVKFAQLQKRKKSLDQDQRRSRITQRQHLLPHATRGQEFPGQVAIKWGHEITNPQGGGSEDKRQSHTLPCLLIVMHTPAY